LLLVHRQGVLLAEVLLAAKEAGVDEVHLGVEVKRVVLDGRAGEREAVFGL